MSEVADLALQGRTAILENDYPKLLDLLNHNLDLRRSMFGDECLGVLNLEMIEMARRIGAASKFTGSGGAVVVFCPNGPPQVKLLEDACQKSGFVIEPVKVVPSCLKDGSQIPIRIGRFRAGVSLLSFYFFKLRILDPH